LNGKTATDVEPDICKNADGAEYVKFYGDTPQAGEAMFYIGYIQLSLLFDLKNMVLLMFDAVDAGLKLREKIDNGVINRFQRPTFKHHLNIHLNGLMKF
jgi:hypothetical protein